MKGDGRSRFAETSCPCERRVSSETGSTTVALAGVESSFGSAHPRCFGDADAPVERTAGEARSCPSGQGQRFRGVGPLLRQEARVTETVARALRRPDLRVRWQSGRPRRVLREAWRSLVGEAGRELSGAQVRSGSSRPRTLCCLSQRSPSRAFGRGGDNSTVAGSRASVSAEVVGAGRRARGGRGSPVGTVTGELSFGAVKTRAR